MRRECTHRKPEDNSQSCILAGRQEGRREGGEPRYTKSIHGESYYCSNRSWTLHWFARAFILMILYVQNISWRRDKLANNPCILRQHSYIPVSYARARTIREKERITGCICLTDGYTTISTTSGGEWMFSPQKVEPERHSPMVLLYGMSFLWVGASWRDALRSKTNRPQISAQIYRVTWDLLSTENLADKPLGTFSVGLKASRFPAR